MDRTMQSWVGLSDEEYDALLDKITIEEFIKALEYFNSKEQPITKIALLYFLDNNSPEDNTPAAIIFNAKFNSLSTGDKVEILRYNQDGD